MTIFAEVVKKASGPSFTQPRLPFGLIATQTRYQVVAVDLAHRVDEDERRVVVLVAHAETDLDRGAGVRPLADDDRRRRLADRPALVLGSGRRRRSRRRGRRVRHRRRRPARARCPRRGRGPPRSRSGRAPRAPRGRRRSDRVLRATGCHARLEDSAGPARCTPRRSEPGRGGVQ